MNHGGQEHHVHGVVPDYSVSEYQQAQGTKIVLPKKATSSSLIPPSLSRFLQGSDLLDWQQLG